jgi:tetratricopeptide (TPR) repeat protein
MSRLEQLQSFYAEDPEDEFVLFALAQEHQKAGNLAQALQFYKTLQEIHPNYVGTYYHFAKLFLQCSLKDEALDMLKQGIAVAAAQSDFHAKAELQNLLSNVEMGLDED